MNVVVNSRSGRTVELVKLAERLTDTGIPFTVITNEPESPVAQRASHVVRTNTRKDDLVSINVGTAMMVTTHMLTAEMIGGAEALQPVLTTLGTVMAGVVDRAVVRADELAETFAAVRPIYLLHRGMSKGTARCGRLVLEEVARTPAVTLEMSEFRQGPVEVVDDRFGGIVFVSDDRETAGLTTTFIRGVRCGAGHLKGPAGPRWRKPPVLGTLHPRDAATDPGRRSDSGYGLQAGSVPGLRTRHRAVSVENHHVRN